jgi:ribonuclease BN (tRNA processing enzyme)
MISNSRHGDRDPNGLCLSPEQFKVLFQVAKELHSLPDLRLAAIDVVPEHVDHLLKLIRAIKERMLGVSRIELDIDSRESTASVPSFSMRESAEEDASIMIRVTITGRLLAAWGRLTEATVLSLGPRELFLRTGYDESEIRQVADHLDHAQRPCSDDDVRNGDNEAE